MSRFDGFDPTDIATEMRERLKIKSLEITQWHIVTHSSMERNNHVVDVSAFLVKRNEGGETIYWLDGVEVRRDSYFTGYGAQFVAAEIIAAKVAEEKNTP